MSQPDSGPPRQRHVDPLVRRLAEPAGVPEGVEHPEVERALLRIGVVERDLPEAVARGGQEEPLARATPLTPLERMAGASEIAVTQPLGRLVPGHTIVDVEVELARVGLAHAVAHETLDGHRALVCLGSPQRCQSTWASTAGLPSTHIVTSSRSAIFQPSSVRRKRSV